MVTFCSSLPKHIQVFACQWGRSIWAMVPAFGSTRRTFHSCWGSFEAKLAHGGNLSLDSLARGLDRSLLCLEPADPSALVSPASRKPVGQVLLSVPPFPPACSSTHSPHPWDTPHWELKLEHIIQGPGLSKGAQLGPLLASASLCMAASASSHQMQTQA